MTNLSEVKNSGLFLCPNSPLCQKGDLRQPKEKSAGLKESGDLLYRGKET